VAASKMGLSPHARTEQSTRADANSSYLALALGAAHRQRLPTLDGVRVQDVGLSGQPDPVVLAWAAQTDRVIRPHDVSTMTAHASAHIADGLPMVGVCAVSQSLSISQALDNLLLLAECSLVSEWKVRYLPL
jgi:hypothetical protein